MQISDIYKKTLLAFLDFLPRGTQSKIADELCINRKNFNGYLNKDIALSEERKIRIAEYLGFKYEEFLALGRRLFQSDEPWLWALRIIYKDEQRFVTLLKETKISEDRFKAIFDIGRGTPIMTDEKQIILAATGFTEEDFIKLGQREILKNPKIKWDLGGVFKSVFSNFDAKSKNCKTIENQTDVDEITQEHFEIVKKFKYKELAKEINEDLLKINNPEVLEEVAVLIRGIALGMGFEFKLLGKNTQSNSSGRSEGKLKNGTED